MRWRGLVAPGYDVASFDFDTGLAAKRFPFIPRAAHEPVGRNSHPLKFRLYFLNSLDPDAFPQLWDEWRPYLFDGESGEMVHPLLGPIDARSASGTVNVEARTTAGVIVDVTFVETLLDPTEIADEDATSVSLRDLAKAASDAMDDAGIDFPDGSPVTDLFDAISSIEGMLYSFELSLTGYVNQVKGQIDSLLGTLRAGQDHATYAVSDLLTLLWVKLDEVAENAGAAAARATSQALAASTTTIDAIARERNNTVAEVMGLNSGLIGSPTIAAGTQYRYYN